MLGPLRHNFWNFAQHHEDAGVFFGGESIYRLVFASSFFCCGYYCFWPLFFSWKVHFRQVHPFWCSSCGACPWLYFCFRPLLHVRYPGCLKDLLWQHETRGTSCSLCMSCTPHLWCWTASWLYFYLVTGYRITEMLHFNFKSQTSPDHRTDVRMMDIQGSIVLFSFVQQLANLQCTHQYAKQTGGYSR